MTQNYKLNTQGEKVVYIAVTVASNISDIVEWLL